MKQRQKKDLRQQQPLRKRIGRLKTAKDVAQYIARCIKKAEGGGDAEGTNSYYKLAVMATMLLKAIEVATFEDRIAKLEELATMKKETE